MQQCPNERASCFFRQFVHCPHLVERPLFPPAVFPVVSVFASRCEETCQNPWQCGWRLQQASSLSGSRCVTGSATNVGSSHLKTASLAVLFSGMNVPGSAVGNQQIYINIYYLPKVLSHCTSSGARKFLELPQWSEQALLLSNK